MSKPEYINNYNPDILLSFRFSFGLLSIRYLLIDYRLRASSIRDSFFCVDTMTGSSFLTLQIVNPPHALLFIPPDHPFAIVDKGKNCWCSCCIFNCCYSSCWEKDLVERLTVIIFSPESISAEGNFQFWVIPQYKHISAADEYTCQNISLLQLIPSIE